MGGNKRNERIGAESISRDGKVAKVVAYRSCESFQIQFEDGTLRKMSNWHNFREGFFNYEYMYHRPRTADRLGTVYRMNNGLMAKVISYVHSHDMDIQFEDGSIARHVEWRNFILGNVAHPTMKGQQVSINELVLAFYLEPLGFQKVKQRSVRSRKIGLEGKEIDLYDESRNIAVEYDGEYAHGDVKKDRDKNEIFAKLGITVYRFREPRCPYISGNCYVLSEAKALSKSLENSLRDFFCKVLERDRSEVDFTRDEEAISKYVKARKRNCLHLFEERIMSNGMRCKIIEMVSCQNITVEFEDGAIACNRNYSSFIKGNIAHPDETSRAKREKRLQQRRKMNNGHEAWIIAYDGWDKVTVRFDNGEIAYNKSWHSFVAGKIGLPSAYVKNCIGLRRLQNRGMFAEIISARDANHIDVRFDDGTIICNRKMGDFFNGNIGNPNLLPARKRKDKERIGMQRRMNDGNIGTIIAYRNAGDVDVDFGDGRVVKHKAYANFAAGSIKCPERRDMPLNV